MDRSRFSFMTFPMDIDLLKRTMSIRNIFELAKQAGIPNVDVMNVRHKQFPQYLEAIKETGEKFGEMLQYVRGEKIWSQEELAEKMNVSFATINRLEKGHHVPSFKTLSKFKQMCKAEGITFED